MTKKQKTAAVNVLAIVAILGATTALVLTGVLHAGVFALAALAVFPFAKSLWQAAKEYRRNTARLLRKAFPKIGFSVEDTEWSDDRKHVRFTGKYREDNFVIEASPNDCAFVRIIDLPWASIAASDPNVTRFLEAANCVNSQMPNISVVLGRPDDEGNRPLYTMADTTLPVGNTAEYLDALLIDILNRKPTFAEAYHLVEPTPAQRRGPIGFTAPQPAAATEDTHAPAAKSSSNTHN